MIICLDGPSGAGKSHLLERAHSRSGLAVIPKFTTRARRQGDNDWEFLFVNRIPSERGVVTWQSVQSMYAVEKRRIHQAQQNGAISVLICTELEAIQLLREIDELVHWYVHRPQTREQLVSLLTKRSTPIDQVEARLAELDRIHEDYLEKLPTIDKVLLNCATLDALDQQFDLLADRLLRTASNV